MIRARRNPPAFIFHLPYPANPSVGYHKRGYPDQSDKKRKGQNKSSTITRARAPDLLTPEPQGQTATRPTPWASDADTVSPDPLGLRRKFRLARPPRGSDADTVSPDPLGLGCKFRLARPLQGSGAKRCSTRSRQGF